MSLICGIDLLAIVSPFFAGSFNGKDFPLPLLLNNAQQDWKWNSNSTLKDIHEVR